MDVREEEEVRKGEVNGARMPEYIWCIQKTSPGEEGLGKGGGELGGKVGRR